MERSLRAEIARATLWSLASLLLLACSGRTLGSGPASGDDAGTDGQDGDESGANDAGEATAQDSASASDASGAGAVTLASGLKEPVIMASDGATLFVSDGNGQLQSMDVQGGSRVVLVDSAAALVAVDAENLYFTSPTNATTVGSLYAMPKAGGSNVQLSGGPVDAASAVRGGIAYWTEPGQGPDTIDVQSSPVQGGSISSTTIQPPIPGPASLLAITSSAAFVSGHSLFAFDLQNAVDGGMPETRLLSQVACVDLVSDDGAAYCLQTVPPSIVRYANDGSSTTLVDQNYKFASGVAIDATDVYWPTGIYGQVMKVPKQGGTVATIVSDESPNAVAVDYAAIYWESGGNIKRLAK